jgi:hypothetical protein
VAAVILGEFGLALHPDKTRVAGLREGRSRVGVALPVTFAELNLFLRG